MQGQLPSWFGVGHSAITRKRSRIFSRGPRSAPLLAAHFSAGVDELIPKLIDGVVGNGEPSLAQSLWITPSRPCKESFEAKELSIAYCASAIWRFAAATMFSGVKPNFFCNSLIGAEAPNVSMPML